MGVRKLLRRTKKYSPKRRRSKNNLKNKKQKRNTNKSKRKRTYKKSRFIRLLLFGTAHEKGHRN